jgi:hypothetical protein
MSGNATRGSRVLSFECYRSLREQDQARVLAGASGGRPPRSPFGRDLSPREIAHRQAMLAHAERSARAAGC